MRVMTQEVALREPQNEYDMRGGVLGLGVGMVRRVPAYSLARSFDSSSGPTRREVIPQPFPGHVPGFEPTLSVEGPVCGRH